MQTFNQALATLVYRKLITQEQAVSVSSFPDELTEMMSRGAGLIGGPAAGAPAPAAGTASRRV